MRLALLSVVNFVVILLSFGLYRLAQIFESNGIQCNHPHFLRLRLPRQGPCAQDDSSHQPRKVLLEMKKKIFLNGHCFHY